MGKQIKVIAWAVVVVLLAIVGGFKFLNALIMVTLVSVMPFQVVYVIRRSHKEFALLDWTM